MLGVVSNTAWDFSQPQNYIFPEIHAEIGLVNNILDNYYTFIDDQVEAVTPEELTSRNSFIVADVVLTLATQRVSNWKEDVAPQLEFHRYNQIQVSKELKKRGLDPLVLTDLRSQQQELDVMISDMVNGRKELEADQSMKRKCAAKARSELKQIQENKKR
jgi:hypothetical protein